MMSFKITAAIFFILWTIAPLAFPVDTVKIEAALNTDLKTINGSVIIRVPSDFDRDVYEIYLPANRYAPDAPEFREQPSGLDKTGFYASMAVDTVLLGGEDVTDRLSVSQSRGLLNCSGLNVAGNELCFQFKTHIPEYGTTLLATNGEFFLGGWFPVPAILPNGESVNLNCANFIDPVGDYHLYVVKFTVPENFLVAAPVKPVSTAENESFVTYSYNFGPAVDFAMGVSSGYMVDSTVLSDKIMKCYYRDYEGELADDILTVAGFAYNYMNEHIGPFIYPELNIVFVNAARPVGMEYPGMVVLFSPRGGALLSNYYEYLAIREVVHQWFYAMISADQCREPWLNKSIAEYFALEIAERYWGRDANLFDFGGFKATFTDDLRLNARISEGRAPVNSRADQFASEIEYSATILDRGTLTMATIGNLLGDSLESVFWRAYYGNNLLTRVSTDSFLELLGEIGGPALEEQAVQLLNSSGRIDYSASDLTYRQKDSVTFESSFVLSRSGTIRIPAEYKAILYNDDTLSFVWDSDDYSEAIVFESPYPAREIIVDPDFKLAIDINLFNNSVVIATDSRPAWRLSSGLMFLIESVFSLMGGW